jgi:hypothetical protein
MAKTIGQLTQATTLAGGDEFIIEQSGLTKRVAASVVRGGLVNADIDAAAAIAFSKLAALDSANLLVGNGSNVATKVAVTGDVTISNAGVTAIGNDKVVTAKILDANVTPAKLSQPLTLATAQATTSGTSIDFTGIPSWVKRITVMFGGVSTSGTSIPMIQLGDSGGIEATGYAGSAGFVTGASSNAATYTDGFRLNQAHAASTVFHGNAVLALLSGASNTWAMSFVGGYSNSGALKISGGSKSLSDALTQVRLTTVNGTDTFDAGSVNIMYEG